MSNAPARYFTYRVDGRDLFVAYVRGSQSRKGDGRRYLVSYRSPGNAAIPIGWVRREPGPMWVALDANEVMIGTLIHTLREAAAVVARAVR